MKTILRILVFLWLAYWISAFVTLPASGINPLGFLVFLLFFAIAIL